MAEKTTKEMVNHIKECQLIHKKDRQKKKQLSRQSEWEKENIERVAFLVPKGDRDKIKEHAKNKGYESTNAYLCDLVNKDMEKDCL